MRSKRTFFDLANLAIVRNLALAFASGLILLACPPIPPVDAADFPIILGMEYAFPGLAAPLAATGLPAAKPFPDHFNWGDMQPDENGPLNFDVLDGYVREYQAAGFSHLLLALRSACSWGSINAGGLIPGDNIAPKPEHRGAYREWVRAVVERYDADGVDDMPGLVRPVTHYEIGTEFSSYEPEPVEDYIGMLELAYSAAHEAFPGVAVLHCAFLTSTVFVNHPGPGEYEAAWDAAVERILPHRLDDNRAILDRPDIFDVVNVHALTDVYEIEDLVRWLEYEMAQRNYRKPIIISDTLPAPFIAWGPADVCDKPPHTMGLILPPAVEADRCRLAAFFQKLIDGDAATERWTRDYIAADMVKRSIVAADMGVRWMNTAFMEDLFWLKLPVARAGAGISAWAGMAETRVQLGSEERTVTALRPLFYSMQQLAMALHGYDKIARVTLGDPFARVYRVSDLEGIHPPFHIAWFEPGALVLPTDPEPTRPAVFSTNAPRLRLEQLRVGAAAPGVTEVIPDGGAAMIILTPRPLYIFELP